MQLHNPPTADLERGRSWRGLSLRQEAAASNTARGDSPRDGAVCEGCWGQYWYWNNGLSAEYDHWGVSSTRRFDVVALSSWQRADGSRSERPTGRSSSLSLK
jgi:hypothetical protein